MRTEYLIFLNLSKKRKLKKCLKLYYSNYLANRQKTLFLKNEERKKIYFFQEKFKYLARFNYEKNFYLTLFYRFNEYQSQFGNFNPREKIFLKFLFLNSKKTFGFFSNLTNLGVCFPNFFAEKKNLFFY